MNKKLNQFNYSKKSLLKIIKHFIGLFVTFIMAVSLLFFSGDFHSVSAQPATTLPCATPEKDGSATVNGNVNTYFSSVSGTINAGATSITLGTKTPGSAPDIAVGDLLLIIQMQDADFNSSNTNLYGDGTSFTPSLDPPNTYANNSAGGSSSVPSQPSDGASGWTNLNNAGHYEFVTVTGISGNTVNIATPTGGLVYTYRNALASSTNGRRSYQIIRVPQYSNVTLNGASPEPWNGQTGGVFVVDVAQTLTLSGTVAVEASGRGFRGGAGRRLTGSGTNTVCNGQICRNTDYRTPATAATNGSKGEGIAGTPRYVLNYFNPFNLDASLNPATVPTLTDTGVEGYPNGSYGRGAPGNAGGGSTDGRPSVNDQNSGGGGGSNGGRGGRGGRAWSSQSPTGGFGGKGFAPNIINNGERLFMGGGGGAGTTNDGRKSTNRLTNSDGTAQQNQTGSNTENGIYSSGAAGGGIVIIRTGSITGNGIIRSQGAQGLSAGQDGAGGGGAGGTVYIDAKNPNTAPINIDVRGGEGGWSTFAAAHGPGGGGGGGVIVTNNFLSVDAQLEGGLAGRTGPNGNATPPNHDGDQGEGLSQDIDTGSSPGVSSGASCLVPNVLLVKRITAVNDADFADLINASGDEDNNPNWPNDYLKGKTGTGAASGDTVEAAPGDEVEYTIYFLNAGNAAATNVKICDPLSQYLDYILSAYDPNAGIQLSFNNSLTSLTNADDEDAGQFVNPGIEPTGCFHPDNSQQIQAEENISGTVIIDLDRVNPANSPSDPVDSFGFVRFRARVK